MQKLKKRKDDIMQYLFVIRELTAREIKRKYARSTLGVIWSVLNPLLTMVVMSLIFSTMFRRNIENFPIYYLTGSIFWTLFNTSTNTSMTALVDNKSLLIKAKLPKQIFVLSRIYTALVNFGYTCIAYVMMLVVFRIKPSFAMLLILVDVLFMMLFSVGIGYVLATEYVFFADIKYLYGVFLQLLMFMSAIFYPAESLSEIMQKVLKWNPVYDMITFARICVMHGRVPDADLWFRIMAWSIGMFLLGLVVFKNKENKVMQVV